jgi:hypothetical protein
MALTNFTPILNLGISPKWVERNEAIRQLGAFLWSRIICNERPLWWEADIQPGWLEIRVLAAAYGQKQTDTVQKETRRSGFLMFIY